MTEIFYAKRVLKTICLAQILAHLKHPRFDNLDIGLPIPKAIQMIEQWQLLVDALQKLRLAAQAIRIFGFLLGRCVRALA